MSVTGHNPVRRADDFYATPAWCTRAIVRRLFIGSKDDVLDPCSGDGAIMKVVREMCPNTSVRGIEIDPHRAELSGAEAGDALSIDWRRPHWVITNPPFSLAMEFVQRAHEQCISSGGNVAMLLRLPWLASQKRAEWLRAHTPSVYVLPKRPSFTGKGTDATDYAWMVWSGNGGITPTVEILDVSDRAGRDAGVSVFFKQAGRVDRSGS